MKAPSAPVPTEKATSAWRNAKARLGILSPELGTSLESLEAVGEGDGALFLVDRAEVPTCPRCEALISRAVAPLGYAEVRVLTGRELRS